MATLVKWLQEHQDKKNLNISLCLSAFVAKIKNINDKNNGFNEKEYPYNRTTGCW